MKFMTSNGTCTVGRPGSRAFSNDCLSWKRVKKRLTPRQLIWHSSSARILTISMMFLFFFAKGKGKVCMQAKWPIRPALNSGFCSMKRLGILLLPPGWDASPSQGYPQHCNRCYPFIHLGEERQCGIKFLV